MSNNATLARQWAVLEALAVASESARMWLSGGWALDFHVGKVTRSHSDIDVIVHENDREGFWDAVRAADVCDNAIESSAVIDIVQCEGIQVEVTYVYEVGEEIVTRGVEQWPWPPGSFEAPPRRFRGLDFMVVSIEGLLDMKTRYEEFFDEPMRPHDKVDTQLLKDLAARGQPLP